MRAKIFVPLFALVMFTAGAVQAQTAGVVTLQANQTSATGSLVPVLTWSTNPVAQSCTASGGWSGNKAASGSQTLSSISASTNYTLTCSWGTGSAVVSWQTPTANTDGSTLTNLAGFKVLFGTSSTSLTGIATVNDITQRSANIAPLTPGTWYFAVRAFNTSNVESANSNVASKVVAGATAARSVSISITAATTPPPSTSGYVTTSTNVWDVHKRSDGVWVRVSVVGQIALGRPCSTSFKVGDHHYLVSRSYVTLTTTPTSTNLVTYCKKP